MSPTLETEADWDAGQSDEITRHEQPTGTDWGPSNKLEMGYPASITDFGANMIAHYPLAEASGTTLYDVHGTYNGTLTGGTQGISGIQGKNATYFDGTDDYGDLGVNFPQEIGTGSMAVSAWVNLGITSWDGKWDNFLINDYNGTGGFAIQRHKGNTYVTVTVNANSANMIADSAVLDSNWHFIYAHYDNAADEAFLRIDDTTATNIVNADITKETGNTIICAQANGSSEHGESNVQHLMIWDGPLTTAEQDILRNGPL